MHTEFSMDAKSGAALQGRDYCRDTYGCLSRIEVIAPSS